MTISQSGGIRPRTAASRRRGGLRVAIVVEFEDLKVANVLWGGLQGQNYIFLIGILSLPNFVTGLYKRGLT
jgi:hypothetical protein